jgi:nucleoside-diphosphate-sugar epimerase
MTYLVLGSSGQIGLALCEYLRGLGHAVLEFDIVNSPAQDLRKPGNPGLRKSVKKADFVFFLAFDVGGSIYLKKYQQTYDYLANNAKIMDNTFDVLKAEKKPFLFASSQMSNMSYSPYGVLKALGEYYARSLGGLITKFWNVYGIENDPEKTHVITDCIVKARDNRLIDLLTDGTEVRQFLYARDCSEALHILSTRYDSIPRDQELHVTNFQWTSILEVAQTVASHFPGTRVAPAPAKDMVQRDKRNEPDPYILSLWKPRTGLKEGIAEVVAHVVKYG